METTWQRFVVISTAAVIALLIASNVLLLQIVMDDDATAVRGADNAKTQVALPQLPSPSKGGSSRALLKELDKTQKQFEEPLNNALTQLDSVSASAMALDQIPALLERMIVTTAAFGDAAPELYALAKRMRSINRQIIRMTKFVVGLGPMMVDLQSTMRSMREDLDRIRVCTESPESC